MHWRRKTEHDSRGHSVRVWQDCCCIPAWTPSPQASVGVEDADYSETVEIGTVVWEQSEVFYPLETLTSTHLPFDFSYCSMTCWCLMQYPHPFLVSGRPWWSRIHCYAYAAPGMQPRRQSFKHVPLSSRLLLSRCISFRGRLDQRESVTGIGDLSEWASLLPRRWAWLTWSWLNGPCAFVSSCPVSCRQ